MATKYKATINSIIHITSKKIDILSTNLYFVGIYVLGHEQGFESRCRHSEPCIQSLILDHLNVF